MILDNFDYCNPFYRIFSLITLSRDRYLIPISKTASVYGSRFIFEVTISNSWQVTAQQVVHAQASHSTLHHAGQWVVDKIGGDAQ